MKLRYQSTIWLMLGALVLFGTLSALGAQQTRSSQKTIFLPLILRNHPTEIGRIGFRGYVDEKHFLYGVNEDGNELQKLTENSAWNADDVGPYWSPDGTKIAYTSNRDGNYDVYVMNANGSNVVKLTSDPAHSFFSSWSPDGQQIAYTSNNSGATELYTMHADGTNVTQVTDNFAADGLRAEWSPLGNKFVVGAFWISGGQSNIYLMDINGDNVENITYGDGTTDFEWAPDGSRILLIAERANGDKNLYVMNLTSRVVTQLTDTYLVQAATWSPNSSQIAYTSVLEDRTFIINGDGSNPQELKCNTSAFETTSMTWSPDGTKITFSGSGNTPNGVYVVNVNNSDCEQIVEMVANGPKWQPKP